MKDPSPATAGTAKPKRLIVSPEVQRRVAARLRERAEDPKTTYAMIGMARVAADELDRLEPGSYRRAVDILRLWRKLERRSRVQVVQPLYGSYDSSPATSPKPTTQPARTRSNVGCKTTPALPRSRSREQSHAPRSTPKAASRSGASGDSSDPPGSSPAALAALLVLLRGVSCS